MCTFPLEMLAAFLICIGLGSIAKMALDKYVQCVLTKATQPL